MKCGVRTESSAAAPVLRDPRYHRRCHGDLMQPWVLTAAQPPIVAEGAHQCSFSAHRLPLPTIIFSVCNQLSAAGPDAYSTLGGDSGSNRGKATGVRNAAREEGNSRAETPQGQSAIDKAIETASAAGSWVVRTGERQGQRLLQLGRDWLAEENRQEGSTLPGEPGFREGKTAEPHAPGRAVAEVVPRQEKLGVPSGKTSDSVGASVTSKTGEDATTAEVGRDSNVSAEGAWRRGRLD